MLPNIPATIRWGTPWLVADQTYLDKLIVGAPRKLDHLQRQRTSIVHTDSAPGRFEPQIFLLWFDMGGHFGLRIL